jgi:hemolysin-activating ACP:hemolysin acyltransferase
MEDDIRYKIDYPESEKDRVLATRLGHAMRILAGCPRRDLSIKDVIRGLWPAIQLGQILFLFNSKGVPVAYATWMHVTEEVACSLRDYPEDTLDLSERNEGDLLWITDIVAPYGDVRALVKKLRQCVPINNGMARGYRWDGEHSRRRLIEVSIRRQVKAA